MALVIAPSSAPLQNCCLSVEFDGDPSVVSSFLHFSDLVVIMVMVCDLVMWAVAAVLMLSIDYNSNMTHSHREVLSCRE